MFKNLIQLFTVNLILFLTLYGLSGCVTPNYGRLTSDQEVTRAFEAYQPLPDHKYYFRGTAGNPVAIAGIHKDYVLKSKLWIEISPGSRDFRRMIDSVSMQGSGTITSPWGFTILDKSGNIVGVWYSAIRAAAIEVDDNKQIINLSPVGTVTRGSQGR